MQELKPFHAASAEGYRQSPPVIIFSFAGTLCENDLHCVTLLRNAAVVIKDLSEKAIITIYDACPKGQIVDALELMGVSACVSSIISYADDADAKTKLCEYIGSLIPSRRLMASSREYDINIAIEHGMHTVFTSYGCADEPQNMMSDKRADTIEQLWKICLDFIMSNY